jgi:hypothetical protein
MRLNGRGGTEVRVMKAKAGDKLLAGSGAVAVILNVLGPDGHPPYIVRWLPARNIAMVDPDPYARVIPARD